MKSSFRKHLDRLSWYDVELWPETEEERENHFRIKSWWLCSIKENLIDDTTMYSGKTEFPTKRSKMEDCYRSLTPRRRSTEDARDRRYRRRSITKDKSNWEETWSYRMQHLEFQLNQIIQPDRRRRTIQLRTWRRQRRCLPWNLELTRRPVEDTQSCFYNSF